MTFRHRILPFFAIILCLASWLGGPATPQVLGQDSLGLGQEIELTEQLLPAERAGTVVAQRDGGFFLTNEEYDKAMTGVLSQEAAVAFVPRETTVSATLVKDGTVLVKVNGQNGPISDGDRITSSAETGVAMKATKSGFSLGTALASANLQTANDQVLVPVLLDIKFTFAEDAPASERINRRLLDLVSLSTIAAIEQPTEVLRYLAAAIILIGSLAFGFYSFGRIAQRGIDALGRNPLASRIISLGMIINVLVTIAIIGVGGLISYLVIVL